MDIDFVRPNQSQAPQYLVVEALDQAETLWHIRVSWIGGGSELIRNSSLLKSTLEDGPSESELRWYFRERFPMPLLETSKAAEVERQIKRYGSILYQALVTVDSEIHYYITNVIRNDSESFVIRIVGPPAFQRIRWELLCVSADSEPLALRMPLIRINEKSQSLQLSATSVMSSLKVLLVTSRTRGTDDIDHRVISRIMDSIINIGNSSCSMTVLKQGTLSALEAELNARGPGFYNIVHFDTHGVILDAEAYRRVLESPDSCFSEVVTIADGQSEAFIELQGKLKHNLGITTITKDLVPAETVAKLLNAAQVTVSVLNSCDSASATSSIIDEFHSRGVRHVLGMSFALSVEAAQVITRTLYKELIRGSPFSQAIPSARKALYGNKFRTAYFGISIELADWLVPVCYSDSDVSFNISGLNLPEDNQTMSIDSMIHASGEDDTLLEYNGLKTPKFHQKYQPIFNDNAFLGRDRSILQIQQQLLEERNALLLRGLGGVGKSTLLQYLCGWWTRIGFCDEAFYYEYSSRIYSLEELVADLGSQLCNQDGKFELKVLEQQITEIHQACNDKKLLIVLDNIEAVVETPSHGDGWERDKQRMFRKFLAGICSSKSYLLIGSRSPERWLAAEVFEDNSMVLGPLDRDATSLLIRKLIDLYDRRQYLELESLEALSAVANSLDRHPLAMKVIFGGLEVWSPREILQRAQARQLDLNNDEDMHKCLQYSFQNMDEAIQQRIFQLAPFSTHVILEDLEFYGEELQEMDPQDLPNWNDVIALLQRLGLAVPVMEDSSFYILQPQLLDYVHQQLETSEESRLALRNYETAVMHSTRDVAVSFILATDIVNPRSADAKILKYVGFGLTNYTMALKEEIKLLNRGELEGTPLIWHLISGFFNGNVKFKEALEFNHELLRLIDRQAASALIFCSQVLNSQCRLYQDLQDEATALKLLKEQLELLSSKFVDVSPNETANEEDRRVQILRPADERIAAEKSQCLEQLGHLATSNYKPRLAIDSLVASAAWQRVTPSRLPERAIYCLNLLAKIYSVSGDENISRVFRYAALMDALTIEDYPALVFGTVLNIDLERFTDDEIPAVQRVLYATKTAVEGKAMEKNDLPSIDMCLFEISIRQKDEKMMLHHAKAAITLLKQIGDDSREFDLFKKLASWYEEKGELSEALEYWSKGYRAVESKTNLGEIVRQKLALTSIFRLEEQLGDKTMTNQYQDILQGITIEIKSDTEVSWGVDPNESKPNASSVDEHDDNGQSAVSPSNELFWQEVAGSVELDLIKLKPTVDLFFDDANEDAKRFSDVIEDRKGFLEWLAEQME